MEKTKLQVQWSGEFIELCMGRVSDRQKKEIETRCPDLSADPATHWYENESLLQSIFEADNWWSVDDLDHMMGLVFTDRDALESAIADMRFVIDGQPKSVDPDAIQLSIFAPEAIQAEEPVEWIVCHGARRQSRLALEAEVEAPFDPSLVTLSLIQYPDHGLILIDLDYEGHDDVELIFDEASYLTPQFTDKIPSPAA